MQSVIWLNRSIKQGGRVLTLLLYISAFCDSLYSLGYLSMLSEDTVRSNKPIASGGTDVKTCNTPNVRVCLPPSLLESISIYSKIRQVKCLQLITSIALTKKKNLSARRAPECTELQRRVGLERGAKSELDFQRFPPKLALVPVLPRSKQHWV